MESPFCTSDVFLASYLVASGHKVDKRETTPEGTSLWYFTRGDGFQGNVEEFLAGEARIEPKALLHANYALRQEMHGRRKAQYNKSQEGGTQ